MTFTVDKIEVDATYTEEYAAEIDAAPKDGHFVVLPMTVRTTDKFTEDIAYVADRCPTRRTRAWWPRRSPAWSR